MWVSKKEFNKIKETVVSLEEKVQELTKLDDIVGYCVLARRDYYDPFLDYPTQYEHVDNYNRIKKMLKGTRHCVYLENIYLKLTDIQDRHNGEIKVKGVWTKDYVLFDDEINPKCKAANKLYDKITKRLEKEATK